MGLFVATCRTITPQRKKFLPFWHAPCNVCAFTRVLYTNPAFLILDEVVLVKKCLEGHRPSQKQLYEHFAPQMLGVCYRYAQSYQEAEDFLQEAFINVFRKLQQYRNEGGLGKWIYRIVVNTCINGIRARCRFSENETRLPTEALENDATPHPAHYKELIEIVRQLPEVYRTVFNLHAVEGYPHDEIAQLLDTNVNTIRSQYSRARAMLMKKLSSEPQKDDHGKRG